MPGFLRKGPTLSLPANKTTQTNVAFGTGDGSTTVFTVSPPAGFSYVYVSTIYRTDWQGTVALSASARTNLLLQTLWPGGGAAPTGWTQLTGTGSSTPTASIYTPGDGAVAYLQSATAQRPYFSQSVTLTSGNTYTLSVLVESVSGLTAYDVLAVFPTTGLTVTYPVCSANPTGRSDGALVQGVMQISIVCNSSATFGMRVGAGCLAPATGTLRMSRPQVELGSSRTSFIPTAASTASVTDYSLTGSTLTLAETPLTGAILSYSGYSYTAAYADFSLPVCGSISISPSGLTSGKLRLTASVDGANFNSTVILPIDEATGILAASSDLPNGLYTLSVKPFKSVRFTQTDVTDTVTISTALGM